ncbi:glycosyl transferase family 2 [Leptolyngbya sp. Heron Island J]|uniref:glycosyltransferase n=1 Tax=Leptolyngbya sp. Heron Island J TaxID=1385935 RepID=UPI0003B9E71C|nr:glycosyltransferase family 2 protein [Leptolyngbya sp. Heron Island J]ESA38884.1 glycosyl transferase family 2 [Leptolyngbya sp. Heron Island J]
MQVNLKQLSNNKDNSNQSTNLVKVSICVATYKRPNLLRDLLVSLNNLTFTQSSIPVIEVIIVDNDSACSAKATVEQIRSSFQWPLTYFVEANQGVTYARNRCIQEASRDSDFIAMLDDDETATPQWLDELLINQQKSNAEIVTGPSLAVYKDNQQVPDWIRVGGFYSFPRYETGKRMETAFTNNVMFSTKLLKNLKDNETLFDNRFAQNGAEDAYLFSCLNKQGYKIVWVDDAVLHEPVDDKRLSLNWILKRGFWSWSVHSFIEAELYPSFKIQAIRAIKGLGLIFIGLVTIVPSLLLGRAKVAWALLRVSRGMGTLSGLLGRQGSWR